ncbi:HNH endonuclease [Paenisporosarcina quisquiliarum]|uniref:HNH endonuclease n=1 Tax=Paenisporosarcina quisquiliarum TaxID=365346 RepID=A0A9X3RF55_9BACL|nr:HNH endonuclease domain-containing protein [Paenisporosarcina quisquiliarum]MCZ8538307.1 HNH endonuclease [Paenisporosarcina quisquiliarum]
MSQGWQLKEGAGQYHVVSEDQIWTAIMKVLSPQAKKTTSYKFALLRAIIENLYKSNGDLEIHFNMLAQSFAKLYWNLVVRNGYTQGPRTQIEKELLLFKEVQSIPDGVTFDSIPEEVKGVLVKAIERNIIHKDVVGALFADTDGILYGFVKKERKVKLTPSGYGFLLKYQTTVFKLVNYELAKFLQKKNSLVTHGILLEEIENITQRESLLQFQQLLVENSGSSCFYTGRSLDIGKKSIAVDHFVPWSFVHSDELWNFVLTTGALNSSKGSKLPAERYLEKIDERNRLFQQVGDVYVKQYMESYDFIHFVKLYKYAELNGFEKGWAPVS